VEIGRLRKRGFKEGIVCSLVWWVSPILGSETGLDWGSVGLLCLYQRAEIRKKTVRGSGSGKSEFGGGFLVFGFVGGVWGL